MNVPVTDRKLEVVIFALLGGIRDGFFIDVGANDGLYMSNTRALEERCGWRGINVEANPECMDSLRRNRPGCVNLNLAMSDVDDRDVEISILVDHRGNMAGTNCLTVELPTVGRRETPGSPRRMAKTVTYGKLVETMSVGKVDLLTVDVEGHEFSVLAGMSGCGVMPETICIEYYYLDRDRMVSTVCGMGYHPVVDVSGCDMIFSRNGG